MKLGPMTIFRRYSARFSCPPGNTLLFSVVAEKTRQDATSIVTLDVKFSSKFDDKVRYLNNLQRISLNPFTLLASFEVALGNLIVATTRNTAGYFGKIGALIHPMLAIWIAPHD